MRQPIRTVTAALVALLAAAACSPSGGTPQSTTNGPATGAPTPSQANGRDVAPAVNAPLDATAFASNACKSLTKPQTEELGISSQGEQIEPRDCSWKFGATLDWVVQLFYTTVEGGLQNDYNKHAAGAYDNGGYFEPTTITGYPAVFSNLSDFRASGTCDLNVGIGGDTIFHVTVTGPAGKDNCKAASTVAANVIETIKTGGE
ncbi:DUF3558 domain-containing protein [Amycolatopsis thermalba]|uniref:DUF3558 domain-containing protein n=1 Tax=Amycolatopsis thermalba TaxID=944492 RepID=A0ABY4P4P7_9PSEU|nr:MULTISPECIES: DUF3558 family protein [Amycolatopsis]UQS27370.1 DUF3558 domain-containing protein [Amycolatopsis thermalba]